MVFEVATQTEDIESKFVLENVIEEVIHEEKHEEKKEKEFQEEQESC